MKNDEIALVVNTVQEKRSAIHDSYQIRREALTDQIPTYTTLAGAHAAAVGLAGMRELVPYAIQALHGRLPDAAQAGPHAREVPTGAPT
jgi:carbamoyl-phosphate synthase large subunit